MYETGILCEKVVLSHELYRWMMLSSLTSQSATVIPLHGFSPWVTTARQKRMAMAASLAILGIFKTVKTTRRKAVIKESSYLAAC